MIRIFAPPVLLLLVTTVCHGQVFDEQFDHWPLHTSIGGTVALATELSDPAILTPLLSAPKSRGSRVVLLVGSGASPLIDPVKRSFTGPSLTTLNVAWEDTQSTFHPDSTADILIVFADSLSARERQSDSESWRDLRRFVRQGGVLILLGQSAAELVSDRNADLRSADGVKAAANPGFWPDCVVRSAIGTTRNGDHSEAKSVGAGRGFVVNVEITTDALLVLNRRRFQVFGPGAAELTLLTSSGDIVRTNRLRHRENSPPSSEDDVVDLTQWRRIGVEQSLPMFPPHERVRPCVDSGTLIIAGGGALPSGLMERFVKLAGGKEGARLVYVPCEESESISSRQRVVEQWQKMGVSDAVFVHTKDRERANSDPEFLKPLRSATGIWFGGGRQWNFSDSYYGTKAHRLMKEVLVRGGVIGGSSAGASIQAQYLARASPLGNTRIMAPGYERGGLGFIGGVAIDQHFRQRGRLPDLQNLVRRYPQLLGIGIDENTAIVVQKSTAEVVGSGSVCFCESAGTESQPALREVFVSAPGRYDLDLRAESHLPVDEP